MGVLQWALLILCLVLVGAVYVFSRRSRAEGEGREPMLSDEGEASGDQLDLLAPRSDAGYDEFGVGRARKRGEAPTMGAPREPSAPSMATLLNPLPGQAPAAGKAPRLAAPEPTASAAPVAPAAQGPVPQGKLVALIVAPTEETDILGPQLHAALVAQGLRFGEGEVYHRHIGGRIVYSVASLLKPGKLIPAEAEGFSTKGLTVVLNLPGAVTPTVAFDDMLSTARAIASALRLEIFDARRERVSDEVGKALRVEIEDWARANKLA